MLPFFIIGCKKLCTYCGDPTTGFDHVFPISGQTLEDKPKERLTRFGPIAHCCQSCNSLIGSKGFETFQDRCSYVAEKLNTRTLAVTWTKTEMKALDYKLQKYVEHEQARRLWMRFRSDWFQSRDYLLNLESLIWEPCLVKTGKRFNQQMHDYFDTTLIWVKGMYNKS